MYYIRKAPTVQHTLGLWFRSLRLLWLGECVISFLSDFCWGHFGVISLLLNSCYMSCTGAAEDEMCVSADFQMDGDCVASVSNICYLLMLHQVWMVNVYKVAQRAAF